MDLIYNTSSLLDDEANGELTYSIFIVFIVGSTIVVLTSLFVIVTYIKIPSTRVHP